MAIVGELREVQLSATSTTAMGSHFLSRLLS
jgi:hypothetical protein